jgi:hypothetical protein
MRRLWIIAALTAVLSMPCAWAQRHGGSFGGGAHMGSFSRGPAMVTHGPSFAGGPRVGSSHRVSFTTSSSGNRSGHGGNGDHDRDGDRDGRHHRYYYRYRYGYNYGYPYYSYPYYGYDPFWDSSSSYDSSDQYYQQNQQLSQQVNELSNEIAQLREEQQIRAYAPSPTTQQTPPQTAAKAEVSPTTVLVFHDQHREEISNYAVVGRTVWVFNQERARKIPLAELDVPATIKVNDDRGIDFNVPR